MKEIKIVKESCYLSKVTFQILFYCLVHNTFGDKIKMPFRYNICDLVNKPDFENFLDDLRNSKLDSIFCLENTDSSKLAKQFDNSVFTGRESFNQAMTEYRELANINDMANFYDHVENYRLVMTCTFDTFLKQYGTFQAELTPNKFISSNDNDCKQWLHFHSTTFEKQEEETAEIKLLDFIIYLLSKEFITIEGFNITNSGYSLKVHYNKNKLPQDIEFRIYNSNAFIYKNNLVLKKNTKGKYIVFYKGKEITSALLGKTATLVLEHIIKNNKFPTSIKKAFIRIVKPKAKYKNVSLPEDWGKNYCKQINAFLGMTGTIKNRKKIYPEGYRFEVKDGKFNIIFEKGTGKK